MEAGVWRGAVYRDTWLSGFNDGSEALQVRLQVIWPDRAATTESFEVPPSAIWKRSLASYRVENGRAIDAVVKVTFSAPSLMFVALWNDPNYGKATTYGYWAECP